MVETMLTCPEIRTERRYLITAIAAAQADLDRLRAQLYALPRRCPHTEGSTIVRDASGNDRWLECKVCGTAL